MRGDELRLQDILDAIGKIQAELPASAEEFAVQEMKQVWIAFHLQLIGEAARHLSDDLRRMSPQTPWRQIIALRNLIVHEYFGLSPAQLWDTANRELNLLAVDVRRLLATFQPEPSRPDPPDSPGLQ